MSQTSEKSQTPVKKAKKYWKISQTTEKSHKLVKNVTN